MLPEPFDLLPEQAGRKLKLDSGALVFRRADKTRGLYVVIQGGVELRRFSYAGHSIIIHRAKAGETFAEASLFSDTYHCDAVATEKTELIELDRNVILAKFADEPEFAMAIAKRFSSQNQYYRRKLELLAIKSANDRILAAVLEGMLGPSIKNFAADIGLSHEVVYRGLAKLVADGVLLKEGRGAYVLKNSNDS